MTFIQVDLEDVNGCIYSKIYSRDGIFYPSDIRRCVKRFKDLVTCHGQYNEIIREDVQALAACVLERPFPMKGEEE